MHTYYPWNLVRSLALLRPNNQLLHKGIHRLVVFLLFAMMLAATAAGQTAQFTQGSNSSNTMTLQVPLGAVPGRGLNLPINLSYSSKVWRLGFIKSIYYTYGGSNSLAEAIYSEYATAGWATSLDVPKVEWPKQNDVYWYTGKPYARGTVNPYTFRIARVFIHLPDGSTHELRKSDQAYQDYGTIDMYGSFYAVDGSRLRYDSNGASNGTLYLPDGSRYVINGSITQYIDRNGNTLSFDASTRQWTDTMGRVIGMPWPTNPAATDYYYSVPGFNGGSTTYTLKFRNLASALTPGSPALKPVGDHYLPYPDQPPGNYDSNNFTQVTQGPSMFVSGYSDPDEMNYQSFTRVIGRGQVGSTPFNPVVLAEIVLPTGQSYKFSYNNFGELDKVIYPTNGYQRYQYGVVPAMGHPLVPYPQVSRGITSRWLSANGAGTDEVQWQYQVIGPGYVMSVTAPDGSRTETSIYNFTNPQNNFGYDDARNGMPFEERIYATASQGGAMLRRNLIEYAQTSATFNRPPQGTGTYTANRNARPIKIVNLILDTGGNALTSANTFQYDTGFQFTVGVDRTQALEYNFTTTDQTTAQTGPIANIPLGSPMRSTETTFLTANANYRNRNLLNLASTTLIRDLSTYAIVAQSSIAYDEPGYPLLTFGGATGWIDPQTTYRGNPTTVSNWLDTSGSYLQTHAQFDQFGNVRNAWDALGRQSQMDYSSTYVYAFATSTSTVVPDSTGGHGQPTAMVSSKVYDFNTGLVTTGTDANSATSTYEYNDSMHRLTKTVLASGTGVQNQSSLSYDDANRVVTGRSDLNAFNDGAVKIDTVSDGLGRTIEMRTYESGSNYISVQTQYDGMGRAFKVSKPFRPWKGETAIWTTTEFDALGRTKSVTTPDGAVATTTYSGNSATATDQAGKKRRSLTDSLGQITRVDEPDANGNLGTVDSPFQPTSYVYDVQGNLRKVTQGVQQRFFAYDSLSRLIRAREPEQATNANLPAFTDALSGNYLWSMACTYDANGNMLTRIDARNITTTYTYDGINRNTSVTYTNDPANTPAVNRYYDGWRGGVNSNIPNSKGRLWQSETGGAAGSRTLVNNYDAMGRVLQQQQQFYYASAWSVPYTVSRTYDLMGHMLTQTLPSGHTSTYAYDQVGRTSSFSGTLGDGATRTYASQIQYTELGVLQEEKFGTVTPLYHKQRYNTRGQLWDMRLSTVSYATDPANGDRGSIVNFYSNNFVQGGTGADNNGNILRQNSYLPDGTTFRNDFTYDSLNRLQRVNEYTANPALDWQQEFVYDQWGNRTIHQTNTWGTGINKKAFTVNPSSNRLGKPSGQLGTMIYDEAGNLTTDSYSGYGAATFDAENRMIAGQDSYAGWSYYTYNADGQRSRRKINNLETWQVYGFDDELLAEYAANVGVATPQKEYGYRNGQLLISATGSSGSSSSSQNVTWTNAVGVSVSGNSLTKNVANAWGNSGAASTQSLTSGSGYVEFTPTYLGGLRACGLGNGDSNQNYTDIDFAIVIGYGFGHTYRVWENGVEKFVGPTYYATTDRFRIAVEGGVVKYYRNGTLFYTSATAPTYPLLVDTALYTNTYPISDVVLTTVQGGQSDVEWLVSDQLGSPRIVVGEAGSLASVKRHDYLPFGEEIFAGTGGRTTAQGYSLSDGVRQHFTGYEADLETGLNFAQARYQSPIQGRFTSVDRLMASAGVANPQSFNRYSYVTNNPLTLVDPTGLMLQDVGIVQTTDESYARTLQGASDAAHQNEINRQSQQQNRVIYIFISFTKKEQSYYSRSATVYKAPNFAALQKLAPKGTTIRVLQVGASDPPTAEKFKAALKDPNAAAVIFIGHTAGTGGGTVGNPWNASSLDFRDNGPTYKENTDSKAPFIGIFACDTASLGDYFPGSTVSIDSGADGMTRTGAITQAGFAAAKSVVQGHPDDAVRLANTALERTTAPHTVKTKSGPIEVVRDTMNRGDKIKPIR